jgi:hypothetical protein
LRRFTEYLAGIIDIEQTDIDPKGAYHYTTRVSVAAVLMVPDNLEGEFVR